MFNGFPSLDRKKHVCEIDVYALAVNGFVAMMTAATPGSRLITAVQDQSSHFNSMPGGTLAFQNTQRSRLRN